MQVGWGQAPVMFESLIVEECEWASVWGVQSGRDRNQGSTAIRWLLLLLWIRNFSDLENTVSCTDGQEWNDLVKFVSVVCPRAMHFLNWLQKHIFLFTVPGSETTAKPVCHVLIVIALSENQV